VLIARAAVAGISSTKIAALTFGSRPTETFEVGGMSFGAYGHPEVSMKRALFILLAFAAGVAVGGWWFYMQGESTGYVHGVYDMKHHLDDPNWWPSQVERKP
jgi:hypothetical protein